jgi:hypothetical protein
MFSNVVKIVMNIVMTLVWLAAKCFAFVGQLFGASYATRVDHSPFWELVLKHGPKRVRVGKREIPELWKQHIHPLRWTEVVISAQLACIVYLRDYQAVPKLPSSWSLMEWVEHKGTRAFITWSDATRTMWVSISGTDEISDWLHNVDMRLVPLTKLNPSWGKVHRGFNCHLRPVWNAVLRCIDIKKQEGIEAPRMAITGHSLGAACASIISSKLVAEGRNPANRINVYLHGCPDVGDSLFHNTHAEIMGSRTIRTCNNNDIVAQIGLQGMCTVGNRLLYIDDGGEAYWNPGESLTLMKNLEGHLRATGRRGTVYTRTVQATGEMSGDHMPWEYVNKLMDEGILFSEG